MELTFWGAVTVLLLAPLPSSRSNCALYGCTSSLSFTCPTDFYPSSPPISKSMFYADLAASYKTKEIRPTGVGCVTNGGKIFCPFTGSGKDILLSWDIFSQYAEWNYTMKTVVTLPVVSEMGEMFVTDGDLLCGFDADRKPIGRCIAQVPITGPVFDLTVVSEHYLYMLYKCGFMVAYSIADGTAFASIWLNTTVATLNGTFIPLGNPAVSGERVYIIAAFKPLLPVSDLDINLRLYAIDVRSVMVGRIKVIWYHDFGLISANIPYLMDEVTECIGRSDPTDSPVGSVTFDKSSSVVVATVNYFSYRESSGCSDTANPSGMKSIMISLTDKGDTYTTNFDPLQSPAAIQAVAYASPNFTLLSDCKKQPEGKGIPSSPSQQPPAPTMWVSKLMSETNRSSIEKINILTGSTVYTMDAIKELRNISVTSRLAIFYNDQLMQKLYCNDGTGREAEDDLLTPLMFGYYDFKDSTNYIGAVDVTKEQAEFLWSVRTFDDNDPVVGQITTVGKGRSTMMALTTTKGAYFYVLFAEKQP